MSRAEQTEDDLDRALKCSLCLSNCKRPKQLPCLHTFCETCLEKYCGFRDEEIPCPLCKRAFSLCQEGVKAFPTNKLIARLLLQKGLTKGKTSICEPCTDVGEENEADSFCFECQRLICVKCKMLHTSDTYTANHTIVDNDKESSYCNEHTTQETELYCCDCRMLICVLCQAGDHNQHACRAMGDIAKQKRDLAEKNRKYVEKWRTETKEKSQQLIEAYQEFLEHISLTESAIIYKCYTIRNLLDVYENEMLNKLATTKQMTLKEIESQNDIKELSDTSVDSFLAYSRMLTERGTDCEIIGAADGLHRRYEELIRDQYESGEIISVVRQPKFIESPALSSDDIKRLVGRIIYLPSDTEAFLSSQCTVDTMQNDGTQIKGVTVVDDEIFVVRGNQPQVNVYDSYSLVTSRDIDIPDMESPYHLAGCPYNKVLYISDSGLKGIHRVDLFDNSVTRWKMRKNHEPRGLSVTTEHTLLVTVWSRGTRGETGVLEYTNEGQLLRGIRFDRSIKHAHHTVKLSRNQFIVSHGSGSSLSRVCVINSEGKIIKSYGEEFGLEGGQLCVPYSLTLDVNGEHIFVADSDNHRVLLFDTDLAYMGEVRAPCDFDYPSRLCFDSSADRLLVGEESSGRLIIISPPLNFV